jgi:hypothetical protein
LRCDACDVHDAKMTNMRDVMVYLV